MKVFTFSVSNTAPSKIDLEEITGATIKTLHSMSTFKKDDLTATVTIAVTLGAAKKAKATTS